MTNPSLPSSPFRVLLGRLLLERAEAVGIPSGRALAQVLGRSAGTVSQMLGGSLVPSGEAVLEIADVLRLSPASREQLLRAAVASKVEARGRDGFWLTTALGWERDARADADRMRRFLEQRGLGAEFDAWCDADRRGSDSGDADRRRARTMRGEGEGFGWAPA